MNYIILNEDGHRLTHNKFWYDGEGWVWTKQEVDDIIRECGGWEFKPVSVQEAILEHSGSAAFVVTYGKPIRILATP